MLSHNFTRRPLLALAACHCCGHLLMSGIRCQTCGLHFHAKCASRVPTLCEPHHNDNYYRHLLAAGSRSSSSPNIAGNLAPEARAAISSSGRSTTDSGYGSGKNYFKNYLEFNSRTSRCLYHHISQLASENPFVRRLLKTRFNDRLGNTY